MRGRIGGRTIETEVSDDEDNGFVDGDEESDETSSLWSKGDVCNVPYVQLLAE